MGRLFNLDSPVMSFLNRMADLLILNLVVLVCCIPIITVGAAFTAMHYVILRMVRDEEGYLIRGFFKSFARNFKQATLIWLFMLVAIGVYIGDLMIFNYSGVAFPKALEMIIIAAGIIMMIIAMYIFPLLARFDNTIKNTMKNAALIAIANLPKTLLMALFYVLPFIVGYLSPYAYIFIFLFGLSLPAYGAAALYSGIFKKFEPEVEEQSDMDFFIEADQEEETNE